jgi:hypothetical protein
MCISFRSMPSSMSGRRKGKTYWYQASDCCTRGGTYELGLLEMYTRFMGELWIHLQNFLSLKHQSHKEAVRPAHLLTAVQFDVLEPPCQLGILSGRNVPEVKRHKMRWWLWCGAAALAPFMNAWHKPTDTLQKKDQASWLVPYTTCFCKAAEANT